MGGGGGGGGAAINSKHGGKFTRKAKSRQIIASGLMLTSMLDILCTMLFFLMKNFSEIQSDFAIGKDISLPYSSSLNVPMPALQLVVTQKAILLDDEKIADIENGHIKADIRGGNFIVPLAQKLEEQKKKHQVIPDAQKQDPKSFAGTIVMQADKSLPFSVLKKVIYTAGVQDFVMLKLAVLKKPDDV
jgi:hypothetical protein